MADRQPPRGMYSLGVDIGTTYSAAAIVRDVQGAATRAAEICTLGTIAAQIPTVVVHRADGEVLIGEAAERRAATEPARTAREFKRRLGDPVPIIVGGTPYGAEALMAEVLSTIVAQVTQRQGGAPHTIVLSHPANYTEYKRGLLLEAARLAGLDLSTVQLIPEPQAAATAYAEQQRIGVGETIAVYDLGGGTFDAAVVRATDAGFQLLGVPEGMERLGGIDFDQAVLTQVDSALGGLLSGADSTDELVRGGQARARDECRSAKEALSTDTDATIDVSIPGVQTQVRITREEFEQMVRPRVGETVQALVRTIASAGLTANDIDRVLLVGGSSRMPIVAQVLRETLGRPLSLDADPKLAIAIGAAFAGAPVAASAASQMELAVVGERAAPVHGRSRRGVVAAALVAGLALSAGAVYVLSSSADDPIDPASSPNDTVSVTTVASPSVPVTTAAAEVATTVPTSTAALAPRGIEQIAFTGELGGAGIPGPALTAAAPAALTAIAVASNGDLYAATDGPLIVRIADGKATIWADISSVATSASGLVVGSDGTLFVSTPAGVVRVSDNGPELILDAAASGLSSELGSITLDGGGNLYVADNGTARIIRRAPDGALTLIAGTGVPASADAAVTDGEAAATTPIGRIAGLAVTREGALLFGDATLHRVRAVARDGSVSMFGGDVALASVSGLAIDAQGNVAVADAVSSTVMVIGRDGNLLSELPVGAAPEFGLAASASNSWLFADSVAIFEVLGPVVNG